MAEQGAFAIPSPPHVPVDFVATASPPDLEQDKLTLNEREPNEPTSEFETTSAAQRGSSGSNDSRRAELHAQARTSGAVAAPTLEAPRLARWRFVAVAVIGVTVVGAVLTLRARKQASVNRAAQAMTRPEPSPQPSPPVALNQRAPAREPSGSGESTLAQNTATQIEPQPSATNTPDVTATAAAGTTRVSLDLRPIDAKVLVRGREIPGPPYEFEIAKGQKIAVEVVRFGFVTAKVVIDDKKPVVSFGMLRAPYKR